MYVCGKGHRMRMSHASGTDSTAMILYSVRQFEKCVMQASSDMSIHVLQLGLI